MADGRKAPSAGTPSAGGAGTPNTAKKASRPRNDDEATIKVASKKETKEKANGIIKLKKPAPKHKVPGNWKEGGFIDRRSNHPV